MSNNNNNADKATGLLASGPGETGHPPVCSCCLAYQALKNQERVRKILVHVQGYIATLRNPSSKARYEGLLSQLADICIQYQEAETVLIRSTESTSSDEFKQAAVKVAGTIIAKAGQQLNGLDDALLKETSKA
jgi:hypothetical protein